MRPLVERYWKRAFLVIMPLALVTVILVVKPPYITPSYAKASRETTPNLVVPLPAPDVQLGGRQLMAFTALPRSKAIPVVLFHGINDHADDYSTPQRQLSLDLALFQHLGYHSISVGQYVAWHRGEKVTLPPRPILITFDDGRSDSYLGADRILAKYHMRATMFVIVGRLTNQPGQFYLSWSQLHAMQNSGRWDIQFHAYLGHTQMLTGGTPGTSSARQKGGRLGYFYTGLRYDPQTRTTESLSHYRNRVEYDLATGLAIMKQHGFSSATMALPFGADGQDIVIHKAFLRILRQHFTDVFIQQQTGYSPSSTSLELTRYETYTGTTLNQLYVFLRGARDHKPATQRSA